MTALRLLLIVLLLPLSSSCASPLASASTVWDSIEQAAGKSSSRSKSSRNKKKKVVIDAGHGGDDYGTHSIEKPRYHEKFLTLATSLMVRDHLKKMGYTVIMTRTRDKFIPLNDRAAVANKKSADLFVSIHYNSAPSRKAHGAEVFFYESRKEKSRTSASKAAAEGVLNHLAKTSKIHSRGVKAGNFAVIRNTKMPAILVEGGFLTNAQEMSRLKDPKMMNKIAWGIAKGVDEYLSK